MLILLKWDLYGIRPVFRQAKLPSYPSNINIMQTPNTTYKNTEIGSIPVDWEVKTYGDIFEYLTTAAYSRAELTEFDEVKYVHYGDIHTKWNFFLDIESSNLPTVQSEQVKNYHLLKEGDIIMADASEDYSGIGKSIEIKNLGSVKAISGQHTFLLRDKSNVFVDGFRGYIHCNKVVKNQFDRLATGLKVYGVSKSNLKTVKIPIPPLTEQTAIANALSDADALINNIEKLITKKRNIKQGAMQKLLQPKEGWEVKKLGEISPLQRGFDLPNRDLQKGIYPVVYSNGIVNYHNRYQAKAPGIVTGRSGTIGKVTFIEDDYWPHNTSLWVTDFKGNYPKYIFYLFLKIKLERFATGSGVPTLNRNDVHDFYVSLPPISEQIEIAQILSDMDLEITGLVGKLSKYRAIKTGMMQNLLTGKIRLV